MSLLIVLMNTYRLSHRFLDFDDASIHRVDVAGHMIQAWGRVLYNFK